MLVCVSMSDRVFVAVYILVNILLAAGVVLMALAGGPTTQICKNPQVIIRDAGTTSTVYPLDC